MVENYLLLFFLVILSIYDCKERQIPTALLYAGMTAAVIWQLSRGIHWQTAGTLLLGILPGMFLLLIAFVTQKAGYGDGMVLAVVGAVSGYRQAAFVLCMGLILASLVSVPLLLLHKVNGRTPIPFLPFLTVAYAVQRLWIV